MEQVKSHFETRQHIQTRTIVGPNDSVYLDVVDTRDSSMVWNTTVPIGDVRNAQLEQAKRALIARSR
jgi:hypothetical protein